MQNKVGMLLALATCLLAISAPALALTLHRGLGPEPDSLDIHQAQGLAAINLLRDLREGLVSFDQEGEPTAGQAAYWQLEEGGRRYVFTLRDTARWSNGDPVTAEDFVRGWQRALSPGSPAATGGLLKQVRNAEAVMAGELEPEELGIRALSATRLEVLLDEPAPWFVDILAHPVSYPLHPEGLDDPRTAPVNGAFVLEQWTPRASLRLVRNDHFHAAETVALDAVEYYPIEEPAAELSRFRSGELHITETIPAGRYQWLRENHLNELRVHPYLGSFWLGINMRHQDLGASKQLRRALALAIDRETLVRVVLGAGEIPAMSVLPPGLSGYDPPLMPEAVWNQQQREQEARRLYHAAGFSEDQPLRIELRYNTSGVHRRMAVAVSAMWKQELGVLTQLVNEEWKVFVNNRSMGVITEVFRGGWIADYADPSTFLELFTGDSNLNTTFYASRSYDLLIESARSNTGNARSNLLREAEAMLLEDLPVIPLYYYVSRHLVSDDVTGFTNNVRDIHLSRYLGLAEESQ